MNEWNTRFFSFEAKIRVKWHLHNNSKLHLLYILYFILLILLFGLFERQWVFDNNVAVLMYSTQQQQQHEKRKKKKKWIARNASWIFVSLQIYLWTRLIQSDCCNSIKFWEMCCHFVYLFCYWQWWSEVLNNSTNQVILNHFH